MLAFILFTVLIFTSFFALSIFLARGTRLADSIPSDSYVAYEDLDWDQLSKLGAYGLLVDQAGRVEKTFNIDQHKDLNLYDLIDYSNYQVSENTMFSYDSQGDKKLLLFFPKERVEQTPTIKVNSNFPGGSISLGLLGLIFVLIYISGTYYLIRRLTKFFQEEEKLTYQAELAEKDRLFSGLAHDMKTPLSAIIGYNQAMKEGLIQEAQKDHYYDKIQRAAYTLKSRLEGLMTYANLGAVDLDQLEKKDILEATRRYVGENYSYYQENGLQVNILFADDQRFETAFDLDLYHRVLENILQNSIDHQEKPVQANISFTGKTLTIKDTGKPIDKDLWEKIFQAMVTGDPSRSGEKNRGLGLANVKRIAKLHNWQVCYDQDGFKIKFS